MIRIGDFPKGNAFSSEWRKRNLFNFQGERLQENRKNENSINIYRVQTFTSIFTIRFAGIGRPRKRGKITQYFPDHM